MAWRESAAFGVVRCHSIDADILKLGGDVLNGTPGTDVDEAALTAIYTSGDSTFVKDSDGNKAMSLEIGSTGTIASYVSLTNNISTGPVMLSASGTSSNVELNLKPKGSSNIEMLDGNGNETLILARGSTAAVNEITITNAATGVNPKIAATGEANVTMSIQSKGTGGINFFDGYGNEIVKLAKGTSVAINEVTITNAASGSNPKIAATGTSSNVTLNIQSQGTGNVTFLDGYGNETLKLAKGSSVAINEVTITNAASGSNPLIAATGTSSNVTLNVQSQGTGDVVFLDGYGNEILKLSKGTSVATVELTVTNAATSGVVSVAATATSSNAGMDIKTKGTGYGNLVGVDADCLSWQKNTVAKVGVFGKCTSQQTKLADLSTAYSLATSTAAGAADTTSAVNALTAKVNALIAQIYSFGISTTA